MISERRRSPNESAGRVTVTSCQCEYSQLSASGIYIDMIGDMGNKTVILGRCPACYGDRQIVVYEPTPHGPGEFPAFFCQQCYTASMKADSELLREEIGHVANLEAVMHVWKCPHCGGEAKEMIYPQESEVFGDE